MDNEIYVLIMAGGVGSRLWPKSRNSLPKQFLNVTGNETLIQMTVRRILPIVSPERIYIATGEKYVNLVKQQLPALPAQNIIAEISGKNTAPAIGLGAIHIAESNPQATMVVLTADHIIPNEAAFREAILAAVEVAQTGKFATLGVKPTSPDTGFGYIRRGQTVGQYQQQAVYQVDAFLEKPILEKAQEFFQSGEYYWNSGMFIWRVADLFTAFETYMPTLRTQLTQLRQAIFQANAGVTVGEIWAKVESQSIDFGLMEKVDEVAVVPLDAGWNDVGSWASLYQELAQCENENVAVNAEHVAVNSQRVMVQGNGKLVATIGLDDVVIVETDDVILICKLDQTQDVKQIVEKFKQENRPEFL